MRFNWLASKAVSIAFFYSAVALSSLFAVALLIAIPGVRQFLNSSSWANEPFAILFIALTVLGIPSMLIMFFGMAIVCACMDHSLATKASWFVVFLATGLIGSMVYYFSVYRGHIKKKRTGGAHDLGVVSV